MLMTRATFPMTMLGLVIGASACHAADAIPLGCDAKGAVPKALCAAVQAQLPQIAVDPGVTELLLSADMPRPDRLVARLSVRRDGIWIHPDQGTLSVVDSPALSPARLDRFATALLQQAGFHISR